MSYIQKEKFKKNTMIKNIFISMVIILMVMNSISYFFVKNYVMKKNIENNKLLISRDINNLSNYMKEYLNENITLLEQLSNVNIVNDFFNNGLTTEEKKKELIEIVKASEKTNPNIDKIWLSSKKHNMLLSRGIVKDKDYSTENNKKLYENFLSDGKITVFESYSRTTKLPSMNIVKRIDTDKGENIGIMSVSLTLESFYKYIMDYKFNYKGYPVIVSKNNLIMYKPYKKGAEKEEDKNELELSDVLNNNQLLRQSSNYKDIPDDFINKEDNIMYTFNSMGVDMYTSSITEDISQWKIAVMMNKDFIDKDLKQFNVNLIIFFLITFLLLSLGMYIVLKKSLKNIPILTNHMDNMTKGNFTQKAEIKDKNEIGIISSTLENMRSNIRNLVVNINNAVNDSMNSLSDITSSMEGIDSSSSEIAHVVNDIAADTINQITEANKTKDCIVSLGERIDEISSYTGIIIENASQINNQKEQGENSIKKLGYLINVVQSGYKISLSFPYFATKDF